MQDKYLLKSEEQFILECNDNDYQFYGPGSMVPIIQKLKSEDKSNSQIFTYLITLGIDSERALRAINSVCESVVTEETINEEEKKKIKIPAPTDLDEPKTDASDETKKLQDKIKKFTAASPEDIAKDADKAKAEDSTDSPSTKIDTLKNLLKDTEKLEKIKKLLSDVE